MAKEYLDKTGLTYFWSKIKAYGDLHWGGGGGSVLDFYPVGSYYETSDTSFNPNTAWGGTWVRETEGLVHIGSGSTYTAGATGGEKTHVLTPAETALKEHTHAINSGDSYFVTINKSPDNGISRRTIKQGTGSELTNNFYSANALVRYANTDNVHTSNGSAHNNMQPYIVVNRWHRTA